MCNFIITTDYGIDINEYFFKKFNIIRAKFPIFLNNKPYESTSYSEFYSKMRANEVIPHTSLINQQEAYDFLEKFLLKGLDIIHITLSSGISSTYDNFVYAMKLLKEAYPKRRISIIDSLSASAGQGLLYIAALQMQKDGQSYEEISNWLELNNKNVIHLFVVDSLLYLQRSGRISKASVIIGAALGMKPLLCIDDKGHLAPKSKIRGRKTSINLMNSEIAQLYEKSKNPFMFIAHADCADDAKYLAGLIEKQYLCDTYLAEISPIIGSHSGPGTLHVAFWGKKRP